MPGTVGPSMEAIFERVVFFAGTGIGFELKTGTTTTHQYQLVVIDDGAQDNGQGEV
jgi:hypothetical protein